MMKLTLGSICLILLFSGCAQSFEQQEMDDMPKEFLEDEDYQADMKEHQRKKVLNSLKCGS